ncbi:hypothetical protein ABDK00_014165 [Niabella insulamsoli]|uniref:hypothetical protein n=1 Tax=Niabella insulamsoli TaxID=3144874 RepID=UPI0031FDEC6E
MNIKPILFSTAMVQAILAGRKTQTRRVCKPQPQKQWAVEKWVKEGPGSVNASDLTAADMEYVDFIENAKIQIGNILWVRETHYSFGHWTKTTDVETGKIEWTFQDLTI